ncbi:MAG: hypothetical protein ACJ74J_06705 [Blastocatellia bacterium]
MSQSPTHRVAAAPDHQAPHALWPRCLETADTRTLGLIIFIISLAVMAAWRLFTQLETGDAAIWDYVAQAILRGQVPYRDVVEIKGPASAYLSALAMWLGRRVGFGDVMAVRFLQMALASWLSVIIYLVTDLYTRRRAAALIAALFPLTSYHFVSWVEGGTQPKLTMIFFGLLTLWLIGKDRPFWAGVCSMMSCLCWQPGLLFAGVAVLVFSRHLTSWRDRRALKVIIGALLPLVITVAYFYAVGALGDLWTWTIAYNFNVYAPEGMRNMSDTRSHLWIVLLRIFRVNIVWVVMAVAGFVIFATERLRGLRAFKAALGSPELFKDALVIAPLVYLAFCLINFQSGPDLLPLFPFIGVFAGWLIAEMARRLALIRPLASKLWLRRCIERVPALVLILVLILAALRAATFRMEDQSLRDQAQTLKPAMEMIGPNDKVYVHGTLELLVLMNRPNLNPYIMWDRRKVDYIAQHRYGGSVQAMIAEMEAEAPRLVALSRLRNISQAVELERWVAEHYDKLPVPDYDIYVRKPQ